MSLSIPNGFKGACERAARTPSQATGVFTRLLPSHPAPGGSCPKRRPGGCCTQLGSPSALKHAVLGLYLLVFLLLVGIFILAGKHALLLCESLWALCAFSHVVMENGGVGWGGGTRGGDFQQARLRVLFLACKVHVRWELEVQAP